MVEHIGNEGAASSTACLREAAETLARNVGMTS